MLELACGTVPGPPVRHADRRRVRRDVEPVARRALRARARHPRGQGAPPDRLAGPAARRAPARPTRPATSSTCWPPTTSCWPISTRRGRRQWVLDECEQLRASATVAPAIPTRPGVGSRRSASSAAPPGASPRPSPPGGSGEPPPPTSPCATSCPTSPSSASPSATPRPSNSSARSVGSTTVTSAAPRPPRSSPRWRRPTTSPATLTTRPRCTSSTVICARPSAWCRRGSASWPATSRSTPACWAPGATSRPCCATIPTPGSRVGWRAELVGEPIRRLVEGEAALAFDAGGELRLEARSGQPLT